MRFHDSEIHWKKEIVFINVLSSSEIKCFHYAKSLNQYPHLNNNDKINKDEDISKSYVLVVEIQAEIILIFVASITDISGDIFFGAP